MQNSSLIRPLDPSSAPPPPTNTTTFHTPHSLKSYLVSLGPPQREEAGEEELAPADDGSQAPVEASHACVCPVSRASLLSPGYDPATPRRLSDAGPTK